MTYYGPKEMAASFRTVRANTIKIAEEIPEESYGFRAAPGCRSVAETLVHIAVGTRLQEQIHITEHLDTLVGFDFFGFMGKHGGGGTGCRAPRRRFWNCCGPQAKSTPRRWKVSPTLPGGDRAIPAGDGAADQVALRNDALRPKSTKCTIAANSCWCSACSAWCRR